MDWLGLPAMQIAVPAKPEGLASEKAACGGRCSGGRTGGATFARLIVAALKRPDPASAGLAYIAPPRETEKGRTMRTPKTVHAVAVLALAILACSPPEALAQRRSAP